MAINFQSDTVGELIILIVALVIKDLADVLVSWFTNGKTLNKAVMGKETAPSPIIADIPPEQIITT